MAAAPAVCPGISAGDIRAETAVLAFARVVAGKIESAGHVRKVGLEIAGYRISPAMANARSATAVRILTVVRYDVCHQNCLDAFN